MFLLLKRSLILTSKLFGPVLILKSTSRRVVCKTDSKTITKDPQIQSVDYICPIPWVHEKNPKKI